MICKLRLINHSWSRYKLKGIRFFVTNFNNFQKMEEEKETTDEIACLSVKVTQILSITNQYLCIGDQEVS